MTEQQFIQKKKYQTSYCVYHRKKKGVMCNEMDIQDNMCRFCGWNPDVTKQRLIKIGYKPGGEKA